MAESKAATPVVSAAIGGSDGDYRRGGTLDCFSPGRRQERAIEPNAGKVLSLSPASQTPDDDAKQREVERMDGASYLGKRNGRPWAGGDPTHVSKEAVMYMRERAEELREQLDGNTPSFAKVLTRYEAVESSCLGFPNTFCKEYMLSKNIILNARNNWCKYFATYNPDKKRLTGGWRRFAADHSLVEGDALVFQLLKPDSLKVYILRSDDFAAAEASAYLKSASYASKYRKCDVYQMLLKNIIAKAGACASPSTSRFPASRRSLDFSAGTCRSSI